MKNICVVTGSRSEYGLLSPVIKMIKKGKRLNLQLVVTGMHLSKLHGFSVNIIKKDRVKINALVNSLSTGDTGYHMAESVAKGISGLAKVFKRLRPDLILILGDRVEIFSAAIAALYMNIPIAHIHGGDIGAGCVDNPVRDAVTKIAHLHFAASHRSYQRIKRLQEEHWRVFNVGSPAIDCILNFKAIPRNTLFKKFKLHQGRPLFLVLQHPVTTEIELAEKQMEETLKAVTHFNMQTLVIYPNTDAGGQSIIKVIKKYRGSPFIKAVSNISHGEYLSLLKYAAVLIGNSSSGIIEAPSFKVPVVNIGLRQEGRQRSTNIIDATHKKNAIIKAIKKALYDGKFKKQLSGCKNPYGEGHAGEKIAEILANIKINKCFLRKQIIY